MNNNLEIIDDNSNDLEVIVNMIESHRREVQRKVNEELISMYWDVGRYLSEKINNASWGSKVINGIADEIKQKFPTLKGFNRAGLYRMVQFFMRHIKIPKLSQHC